MGRYISFGRNRVRALMAALAISAAYAPVLAQNNEDAPPLTVGQHAWTAPAPGFDVTELPVLEGGREVERIHLTRIDPARYKFEVHTAPAAARELHDWMNVTGAVMIVNGSYFDRDGNPATPVVSRGHALGPKKYGTKHGAFIVTPSGPVVQDLGRTRWQTAFRGASEAMVSFPMLIGADGQGSLLKTSDAADEAPAASSSALPSRHTSRSTASPTFLSTPASISSARSTSTADRPPVRPSPSAHSVAASATTRKSPAMPDNCAPSASFLVNAPGDCRLCSRYSRNRSPLTPAGIDR